MSVEPQPFPTGRFAEALIRLFDVLLQEEQPEAILNGLARILGETLQVDRSLVYDVSFSQSYARCLTEWLAPGPPAISSTKATYPLSVFRAGAEVLRDSHDWLESHADAPHPALLGDGSATVLHRDMRIQCLLWYPFSFRADGFYALVFNHVSAAHTWNAEELAFVRAATRHASMALVKIALLEKRARTEQAMAAAQKLESLGLLAGGIAHDFNNMMVGVVTNAELVLRRLPNDSPLRPLVLEMLHAGERAAALAGQLLAYAGKGPAEVTIVEPRAIIEETAGLLRSSFPGVSVDLRDEGAPPIACNRVQLEQVVMNLLVNAAEATPEGSGAVRVWCRTVDLDPEVAAAATPPLAAGRYAMIAVGDSGPGMDAGTLARIFDPFFTTKPKGRGLGLSAVQGIVRQHGGAISVRSTPGTGSTFSILWPAARGEASTAVTERAVGIAVPRRVLVIDDDPGVLSSVTALLQDRGVACEAALGGAAGLEAYRAHSSDIDCVLLDLTMPAPDGRDVLRQVRAMRADQPVVLMSGYSEDPIGRADAHTQFIKKPFTGNELVAAIAATGAS